MREETPSVTALAVAYFVLILGQTACNLLPPGIIPLQMALLEAVNLPWKDYIFLFLLRSPIGPFLSRFVHWLVGLLCKNGLECIAFRKSFIEQRVRKFLDSNKDNNPQVLILAAGYDTLSLRLARHYPNAKFWEIDHPATGNFKNKIWDMKDDKRFSGPLRIIGEKPANIFHASVDLTQKDALVGTLASHSQNYDTSSPTIVILEGLLMYFTTHQVYSLFEEISKAIGPGSLATFDMMATKYVDGQKYPDIGILSSIIALYVKLKGEPWMLGLDEKTLQEFVDNSDTWGLVSEVQSFGPANLASIMLK